ncbi:MAG: hypothetical protein IJS47_02020 [Clostridia bacterium]|nr:hypothetical protein [Clostridia bacterium]MBQ9630632.1 hypothetical protein [Treponema sp.]
MKNYYKCYCLHTFRVVPTTSALKHGFRILKNEKYSSNLLNHDADRYVKEIILEDTENISPINDTYHFNQYRFNEVISKKTEDFEPAKGFVLRFCLLFNTSYDKSIVEKLLSAMSHCFYALDSYTFTVSTVDYILFTAVTNLTPNEFLREFNQKTKDIQDLHIL